MLCIWFIARKCRYVGAVHPANAESVYVLLRAGSSDSDDAHSVVATARGVFDSKGGVLESKETGILS